jgi:hypothetical protein
MLCIFLSSGHPTPTSKKHCQEEGKLVTVPGAVEVSEGEFFPVENCCFFDCPCEHNAFLFTGHDSVHNDVDDVVNPNLSCENWVKSLFNDEVSTPSPSTCTVYFTTLP